MAARMCGPLDPTWWLNYPTSYPLPNQRPYSPYSASTPSPEVQRPQYLIMYWAGWDGKENQELEGLVSSAEKPGLLMPERE